MRFCGKQESSAHQTLPFPLKRPFPKSDFFEKGRNDDPKAVQLWRQGHLKLMLMTKGPIAALPVDKTKPVSGELQARFGANLCADRIA